MCIIGINTLLWKIFACRSSEVCFFRWSVNMLIYKWCRDKLILQFIATSHMVCLKNRKSVNRAKKFAYSPRCRYLGLYALYFVGYNKVIHRFHSLSVHNFLAFTIQRRDVSIKPHLYTARHSSLRQAPMRVFQRRCLLLAVRFLRCAALYFRRERYRLPI